MLYALLVSLASASPATDLEARFEERLADPAGWKATVEAQPENLIERDLFAYVLPALAYTNLAVQEPARAAEHRARLGALLDLLLPEVVEQLDPPNGRLEELKAYDGQSVWLGQLALVLGCWRLAGGDDRYDVIHAHISGLLHDALVARKGAPLDSYPGLVWPFDTIPVALALHLYDRHTGVPRSADAIEAHLRWQDEHVDATGLPHSRVHPRTLVATDPPRGCDLSLRIALLAQLDRQRAKTLYASYVKAFWRESAGMVGFAEYPVGVERQPDPDSGPIVFGFGTAATGFGIAAARATGDTEREGALVAQVDQLTMLLPLLTAAAGDQPRQLGIHTGDEWSSGFPMGDAALFFATTWTDWGTAAR